MINNRTWPIKYPDEEKDNCEIQDFCGGMKQNEAQYQNYHPLLKHTVKNQFIINNL